MYTCPNAGPKTYSCNSQRPSPHLQVKIKLHSLEFHIKPFYTHFRLRLSRDTAEAIACG